MIKHARARRTQPKHIPRAERSATLCCGCDRSSDSPLAYLPAHRYECRMSCESGFKRTATLVAPSADWLGNALKPDSSLNNTFRALTRACFFLLLLACARPAVATDNYAYKDGEYVVIAGGRSPDARWSIAAHGGGDAGYGHFDLYLMSGASHENLAPLRMGDCLDTGPLSIIAVWAPDSKHVAVLNRSGRHVLDLRLLAVADGKVSSIKVPLLLDVVGKQHLKHGVHYEFFSRLYRLTWRQADLFTLQESDTLDAVEPIFSAGIEPYLTLDRLDSERVFTDFSAEATCEISAKGELRLVAVKALPQSTWPNRIVYSPHLLFESGRGLHNTETSLSSLEAQKEDSK